MSAPVVFLLNAIRTHRSAVAPSYSDNLGIRLKSPAWGACLHCHRITWNTSRPARGTHVTAAPEQKKYTSFSPAAGEGASRLFGIGEMAELTRTFDWSQTSIGPIDRWPEVLLNAVNTLLNSRHPMFLWWGEDLVQFYNDAYRPSLGVGKHPMALGQKGEDCWPEIWPIIFPQIEAVMTRGEATWHENQLVPIYRNGRLSIGPTATARSIPRPEKSAAPWWSARRPPTPYWRSAYSSVRWNGLQIYSSRHRRFSRY